MRSIVLIGMPGCGKSTVGRRLSELLNLPFLDTDDVIQARSGRKLQAMVDEDGIDCFLEQEADAVCSLEPQESVIATGAASCIASAPCAICTRWARSSTFSFPL